MQKFMLVAISTAIFLSGLLILNQNCGPSNIAVNSPPDVTGDIIKEYDLDYDTRSFHMGFTSWPPGPTINEITYMYNFINKNGDVLGHQFDNGVPWVEAYDNSDYDKNITNDWQTKKTATETGKKIFLSIMPFNEGRDDLAPYKGPGGQLPLPDDWKDLAFNDEKVKQAFLNYAITAVTFFDPDYLCTGLEVNTLLEKDKSQWDSYVELQQHVYTGLKEKFPNLKIMVSIEYNKLKGLGKTSKKEHQEGVQKLMPYIDILGLSVYTYGGDYWPVGGKLYPIPDDFFADALQYNKPIAITESGAPSKSFSAYNLDFEFNDAYQLHFIDFVLEQAHKHDFEFVINWASIDFNSLVRSFSRKVRELATLWVYIGLEDTEKNPKPAYYLWNSHYILPYAPDTETGKKISK